ncbi:triadin isoform X8 [Balaenoptera ricei]|uniref:triadin isoform X8 n=1 Tax=Balaenoptera ricei TaxID=2746895 RepID=UPI0028BDD85D|nr:triadin isoform X8 [Balaenoptera ricei]
MTEITAEGNTSTTTTVVDSKNGSVPKSPGKVVKRTVTEDIVTTFSSPAAWLLVIALIITWSAVAIVMFDLVDYRNFSASSISKMGSDPLRLVHDAVEETTDWVYGFFSLLSDIISSEGDEEDNDDGDKDTDKGEVEEPPLKKKEIHKEKTEKQEKTERKIQTKVTHKEKEKDKEKGKPEKKATHKEKIEKKEKPETKTVAKEEKKPKTKEKTEEKIKKEVKGAKQEKVKQTAAKVKEAQKTSPKPKEKDKKDAAVVSKHEQKDQYAFCRYMIDIFVHGDLKPGQSPAIPPPLPTEQASGPTLASPPLEEKEEEKKKAENKVTSETKKEEKEDVKTKTEKETAMDVKKKDPGKVPEAKQGTIKIAAQATKKDEKKEDSKKTRTTAEELPKGKTKSPKKGHSAPSEKQVKAKTERAKEEVGAASTKKAVPGKKEEKTTKTVEQDIQVPNFRKNPGGDLRRWWKSKTRRSPSSPQIHQKYIYTWNCSYRTPTERWQKTSDLPKEIRKEKSGKTSSVLKDKEPIKGKEVKVPASLKEKEPEIKKHEKMSKAGKEVKPKSPQPQIKKEDKPESQVKKEAKPASSEKAQIHKQDIVKPEKTVSHGKPDEKVVKQAKAITIEKTVKPKPTKKAEHQEKESPSIKTDKPKPTPKETSEVTASVKKKIEKSEKESKEKAEMKHLKEEKVPTRKEGLQLYNVTKAEKPARVSRKDSEDVPASTKAKEEAEDVPSTKKQKSPISFFQCVYLDGYNGYGFQFPVTPAHRPGESSGQPSSPGEKQQRQ